MKRISKFLACVSLAVCMSAQAQSAQDIEQAKAAATSWLALADSNRHASTWTEAAEPFRKAVSQSDWTQTLQAIRTPLGALKSRSVKSATFAKNLPGGPEGDYVVITFASVYANKADTVETVTPARTKDGSWKVSGYYIR
ncbi:DUF4019 domain-containing protein [Massilia sp. Root418]|uniref:DUF4019 domain-containing protein n=1 Tax=Massilia sp. Root418 TaxID=1736532 RepID=UPI0006FE47FA|nr:DUF4019 domain-containing protein [Massilia sp. Root418]